jgi:hypothetical protein
VSDSAKRLDLLRRYAHEAGIPVDCVDTLALSIPRAARMIDVSPKVLRRLLVEHHVPVIDLGPRCERILTTDLVDFLWERRRAASGSAPSPEICPNTKEQVLAALRD